MTEIFRKPKIGVLLIEAERFRGLGEGTARGTYAVRKDAEAAAYIEKIKEFADGDRTEAASDLKTSFSGGVRDGLWEPGDNRPFYRYMANLFSGKG